MYDNFDVFRWYPETRRVVPVGGVAARNAQEAVYRLVVGDWGDECFARLAGQPEPGAPIGRHGWALLHKGTLAQVCEGDVIDGKRITGGREPHKSGSSGFVWLDPETPSRNGSTELYAHTFGLQWAHPKLRPAQ